MFMNILPKHTASATLCAACLLGFMIPSVAQAGFDWAPPRVPAQQAAPQADVQQTGPLTPEPDSALPVPVGHVEKAPAPAVADKAPDVSAEAALSAAPTPQPVETKEPLVLDNTAPAPEVDAQPVLPVPANESAPAVQVEEKVAPVVAQAAVAEAPVEGFGKEIPLAIALREIAPSKYAYSFTPRDLGGAKISWRGGKPWREVLQTALAPLELDMIVTENAILISQKHIPVAAIPAQQEQIQKASDAPTQLVDTPPVDAPAQAAAPSEQKPPVATAVDMKSISKWQARPGSTLRQTLESWSKQAKVELNWSTAYDYPINNSFYFDGTFSDAVASLLSSYGREAQKPKGRFYPNLPEGPSVLMIN